MLQEHDQNVGILSSLAAEVEADNAARCAAKCDLSEQYVQPCERDCLSPTGDTKHDFGIEVIHDAVYRVAVNSGEVLCVGSVLRMLKHEFDVNDKTLVNGKQSAYRCFTSHILAKLGNEKILALLNVLWVLEFGNTLSNFRKKDQSLQVRVACFQVTEVVANRI
jgi:hypothetical protein